MKFRLLQIALLLSLPFSSWAQRNCGSVEHHQHLIQSHPEIKNNRRQIEENTQRFEKQQGTDKATGIVYTIPVVVHIVYRTAAENISDAQVLSQIAVLNEDYRMLNADHVNTPALFAGLKSDAEIQFCLAKQDPTGAATTGITRTVTTRTTFGTNDAVKSASTNGKAAWNTSTYLNLWVCNIGGGILGYAQFPGGPASTDGVVIDYRYFGRGGSSVAPFNKGRTGTHEVGHWLNLNHIWGDDGTSCSGTDNVADTPNQADENYGCPSYPTASCSNTSDMYMNYMDYTDDACMYMFSAGQATRMRSVLAPGGARASLANSSGCNNPTGTTCGVPAGLTTSAITQTTATLGWGAVSGAVTYNVQVYNAANTLLGTYSTATNSYNASGFTAATSYKFAVQTICSGGSSAYSATTNFTTASAGVTCGTPTGLASSAIAQTTATVSWTAVSGATSYNLQYKTAAAASFTSVTTSATSYNLTGLVAATAYVFQVQSVCAGGTSAVSSQGTFTTLSSGTVTYCTSKGTSQADEWIDRVSLGGMTRTSGKDAGYIYYTTASANVTAGSSYSLGYSAAFTSTAYTEYWRVYIDWNKNGVFTDAGEQVVSRSSSSAANLSTTITVPATAKNGTTRMRVVMKYGAYGTSCETFTYGEVEDYNVVVSGGVNREIQSEFTSNESPSDFQLYPNPASDKIVLSKSELGWFEGATVMMVDMKGKTWKKEALTSPNNDLEKAELSVDNLPNGLYNVIIFSGDSKISKKVLVLHP
ncbi:MAG TPA: GEVED domain-containing protein [Catalimonadaceae bacterium]|nr:GEVED domain-containing protein [Catalimonadaceae bacterium]HPI09490.1 GEVED domain-containing protein [Catalimonadaceae bacterium]